MHPNVRAGGINRTRGFRRAGAVATGVAVLGGVATTTVAVALAVSRPDTSSSQSTTTGDSNLSTGSGGQSNTGRPNGGGVGQDSGPSQDFPAGDRGPGGVAPGDGGGAPQGRSQGS